MATPIVLAALIGTLQFNSAFSAAINYEPIKITVNENFNAQPGQVSPELQDRESGIVHQGANFYFKPQLNLPSSYISSHIEALLSLIQEHRHSCAKDARKVDVEKGKLIEILKPFKYPLSDISEATPSEIVLENEDNLEIVKPIIITEERKPFTPEFLVVPEAPVLPPALKNNETPFVFEEVKKDESEILEESSGVFITISEQAVSPISEPIINYLEPKLITQERVDIQEAPVLPQLSVNDFHIVEKEVKIEEPTIVAVEPKPTIQELVAIPEAPVLPSLSLHDISSIIEEEVKKEESIIWEESMGKFPKIPEIDVKPIEEPVINYIEPKPTTSEIVFVPEAPVLPPLSISGIPPTVEEEIKKEESVILEQSRGALPETTIIKVEPKPITLGLVEIPEAPVLPPLSFDGIPPIVEEEVKKEESIIFEEPTAVFSSIPEVAVRPITEPIINYLEPKLNTQELVEIPEAPVLPPLSANDFHIVEKEVKIEEPIIVAVEPKPTIQELVAIPEAPVLPSLSLHDISSLIKEEVKKEESIIWEESMGKFPKIPEIDVKPIEEPVINYIEPKPTTSEIVFVPEAPVLPPLSISGIPPTVEEEIKKEESVILEQSRGALPETTIIKVEPKPITLGLVEIPEAPVLPPLSFDGIPPIVEEEVKKEESIIFEEPAAVFSSIPEVAVRPISEPIINYLEPKLITQELVNISEAPVLPPLSANDFHIVEKEVKIEEPIIVAVEPKPTIQELVAIPEAPVLPSLSLHDISSIIEEEVKKEESIIWEESMGKFPKIPEIDVKPIEEPVINYIEPKPTTSEIVFVPEAPVLPPLSISGIPPTVEEEIKKEESVILEQSRGALPETTIIKVEPKPITLGLVEIPEAPVLPPLSFDGIPPIVEEEVKKEESIIFEEPAAVFSSIPEVAVRPITEPIINYLEPKLNTQELVEIPEAPVLPPLSANDYHIVEKEVKIEEPIIVTVEPKPTIQELVAIPEPPVLSLLSRDDISSTIEEEVKKEESIIREEPTGVFPKISQIDVRPIEDTVISYVEPKPITSEIVFLPEAPVLPQLTANINHVLEEKVKIKNPNLVDFGPSELVVMPEAPVLSPLSYNGIPPVVEELEESIKVEESPDVFPSTPEISAEPFVVSANAESYALENNIFPVATEELKIEIPILLEESIEVFRPISEISSRPTLQDSEATDSFVLEEASEPNPESVLTVKETLPPTIIPKPSNNLGVISYVPFLSRLSNRAPKTKNLMIPKPASLERFLLKKHPFRLPVTPFPKLSLKGIKASMWGNKKQFLHPTSYAHDVVEKRIASNMGFKEKNGPKRVKIYLRSNVPKGPSYL